MPTPELSRPLLDEASDRAADNPYFLAHDLQVYAGFRGWTRRQLAAALNCPVNALALVGLCRTPWRDSRFQSDVGEIAARFKLESQVLANLLREVDLLMAFDVPSQSEGWLAAARERAGDDDDRER
jgi:hypothetical protein